MLQDYAFKTSFWSDFSIADVFGVDAIKETYKIAFNEWKHNYVYLTELVLVLNWKIWEWYEKNQEIARMYNDFWEEADAYASDNLKGEELTYFYHETD